MSETTAANAAFIQSEIQSILVQPLEAASIVLAAGPKIIDSAAPIRIPVISGGPSGRGCRDSTRRHHDHSNHCYANDFGRCEGNR